MSRSPWKDPPLTGTPLDYVPIDRPINKTTPTQFKAPTLRRAAIAAGVAGAAVAVSVFAPAVAIGAFAIAFIGGGVWAADKLIKAIDSHDDR
jgi:hypothetical protein